MVNTKALGLGLDWIYFNHYLSKNNQVFNQNMYQLLVDGFSITEKYHLNII